jgi:hypothetical protein
MSKTANSIALIAQWTLDQDSSIDPPRTVRWADSTPATHNDYLAHLSDTHICVSSIEGVELHMFPDIIADVRYDYSARTWVIGGIGITPVALGLTDPDTPDDHIEAEIYTYPIIYRARIHRRPTFIS